MSIFALQSPAGGFLDEDMQHFNKQFDDWCAQFESYEDAELIAETLDKTVGAVKALQHRALAALVRLRRERMTLPGDRDD